MGKIEVKRLIDPRNYDTLPIKVKRSWDRTVRKWRRKRDDIIIKMLGSKVRK